MIILFERRERDGVYERFLRDFRDRAHRHGGGN